MISNIYKILFSENEKAYNSNIIGKCGMKLNDVCYNKLNHSKSV